MIKFCVMNLHSVFLVQFFSLNFVYVCMLWTKLNERMYGFVGKAIFHGFFFLFSLKDIHMHTVKGEREKENGTGTGTGTGIYIRKRKPAINIHEYGLNEIPNNAVTIKL